MGIRYYAYAFDPKVTERALADPRSVIGADPLADAWGLEPGFTEGVTNFEQSTPEHSLLYLDKAWSHLQRITEPPAPETPPRPAYRMFEGSVSYVENGMAWRPWVRTIPPLEVPSIAADLETITVEDIQQILRRVSGSISSEGSEISYATHYFLRAKGFVQNLAAERRGFAYLIG